MSYRVSHSHSDSVSASHPATVKTTITAPSSALRSRFQSMRQRGGVGVVMVQALKGWASFAPIIRDAGVRVHLAGPGRLTDAEFDLALKPERKPTSKAPGYWRCVFAIPAAHVHLACACPNVWRHFFADEWVWIEEAFPEEAVADARGADILANAERAGVFGFAYRRAEYFPDYGGAS